MERNQIERHFFGGNFDAALTGAENSRRSPWCDTMKLRCLRAMQQGSKARAVASKLFDALEQGSAPYPLTNSERINQLRYIALIFAEQGLAHDACEIMASLCKQNTGVADLHREYAFALSCNNQSGEAENQLNLALELQPIDACSYAQLGRIYCRTGRVNAGTNSYSKAATIDAHNPNYLQRLIYWNNYSENTNRQSSYQLTRLWASKAHPSNRTGTNTWRTPNPNRQIKVAMVSSGFSNPKKSCFITPLLSNLNRRDFHITAYSNTNRNNDTNEPIRQQCDSWQDTSEETDRQLAVRVAADQIDILIDLDGHHHANRLALFASHVAPIQLSWLGYPSTTGLKSIDYCITDRICDPIGINDRFYTETLIRLPNGGFCYAAPTQSPQIKPSDSNTTIRFGSFNNLAKISSQTLDCWAAAMLAVPNSNLTLKHPQLSNQNAREFFTHQLVERGVSPDRLTLNASEESPEQRLEAYNNIDIALDTSPYNGVTTTLEALWMGVPIVSLTGRARASRLSLSILERLNLSEITTSSVSEFAERARELSELTDFRNELRHSLRDRMRQSSLMDAQQFSHEFSHALRSKWRLWCEQRNALAKQTSQKQPAIKQTTS